MASAFITIAKPFNPLITSLPCSSNQSPFGLRRSNVLKVNAISKKFEPTKVVPQADRVLIRLETRAGASGGFGNRCTACLL